MVLDRILQRFAGNTKSRKQSKRRRRRMLVEALDRRELLAADIGEISGIAFVDNDGNNALDAGDTRVVSTLITLYADDNPANPGTLVTSGPNADTQLTTDNTAGALAPEPGFYRFSGLAAGDYFVVQDSFGGLTPPAPALVTVTDDNADGKQIVPIDTFTSGTQNISVFGAGSNSSSVPAPDALGDERDVEVTNNGAGNATFQVITTTGLMSLGTAAGSTAQALVEYDGTDGAIGLDFTPGFDPASALAGGNPGDTVSNDIGLELLLRGEILQPIQDDAQLTVTIYSSPTSASATTIDIPQSAVLLESVFVPFVNFTQSSELGVTSEADFNSVVAVTALANIRTADQDVFFSVVESRGPDPLTVNLQNEQLVSLGGTVFADNNPGNEQNNGMLDAGEGGIENVVVQLFGSSQNPATAAALATTTTDSSGNYNFADLNPGEYVVVIPDDQSPTNALQGFANSDGNDNPNPPDTDLDVDNDDDGRVLAFGVASAAITLVAGDEPGVAVDGDDDNTNSTVDFGFVPEIDLSITKTLTPASVIERGATIFFDVEVSNAATAANATGVTVTDVIPDGLTFDLGSSTFPGIAPGDINFNSGTNTLTVIIGGLDADDSVMFTIAATIDAAPDDLTIPQTNIITNTASVIGNEVETNTNNNDDSAPVPFADLVVTKTADPEPVSAGNQLVYTISVTNNGPAAAVDVEVTDELPTGVTFNGHQFAAGSGGTVDVANNDRDLTITFGNLASGATESVEITVDVAPDADPLGTLDNTANVLASPNNDPRLSNNSSTASTGVVRNVDVGIDKSVNGTPVAGEVITYVIDVFNLGPGVARDVIVTDVLDGDLTFVAGSFDPGTSAVTLTPPSDQTLSFDVGTLGVGTTEAVQFSFDVRIDSSAQDPIPNTASVTTSDNDPLDDTNDNDTETIDPANEVDLRLTKTVDLPTAIPGEDELEYTITVFNDGPSDAFGVVVTDNLPAGLLGNRIVAPDATSTGFDSDNQIATITFATIPAGESELFRIFADTLPGATGTVINPAEVMVTQGTETDSSNNDDTAETMLTPRFDVGVTKTVNNSTTPGPNDTVSYNVRLGNDGPSTATGVVLSDDIPSGLTFVSGTLNGQSAVENQAGSSISFPQAITLAPDEVVNATLTFTVDADASGDIVNTASITTDDGDTLLSNNTNTATITATPRADISVTKDVDQNTAQAGTTLEYTITVTNDGPSTATNVVATDTLPSGVTFAGGTGPSGETLTANNGVVTVNGGDLADNDSFMFTIRATINAGVTDDQVNEVVVATDTFETIDNNNDASARTGIDPATASIAGRVYMDRDNDGIQDPGEEGLEDVLIMLTGTDSQGNTVNREVMTNVDGDYLFAALAAGTYEVTEVQPFGIRDGLDTDGTGAPATVLDDMFANMELEAGDEAINFNFGERPPALSKRMFLSSTNL